MVELIGGNGKTDTSDKEIWVMVSGGGKTYIGCLGNLDVAVAFLNGTKKDLILQQISNRVPLALINVYEVIIDSPLVPAPQGLMKMDVRFMRPVDNCLHGARLYLVVDRIHFFEDMAEDDQQRNKKLVKDLQDQLTAARAQESGLILAGSMPNVPRPAH